MPCLDIQIIISKSLVREYKQIYGFIYIEKIVTFKLTLYCKCYI